LQNQLLQDAIVCDLHGVGWSLPLFLFHDVP
jgi:hypothetical protein